MAPHRESFGSVPACRWLPPALPLAALLTVPVPAPVAVDARLSVHQPALAVSGVIACAGADNLAGILQAWARGFTEAQPAARVDVDSRPRLSSEGLQALLDGRAEIAPFARELFPSEIARFQQHFGHPPLLVCIGLGSFATPHDTDALAIYVNAANPLQVLTQAEPAG